MADISKIRIPGGTEYDLKDATARAQLADVNTSLVELETSVDTLNESVAHLDRGLTDTQKAALLACFRNVAWTTGDSEEYYDALESALYEIPIASISAVYNPGSNIIYTEDSLNDLKQYITVTALYETGASAIVTDYTLAGTLAEGNNTITIAYKGKSTTITVNVVNYYNQYTWQWTASGETSIVKQDGHASISSASPSNISINQNLSTKRRAFVVEKGKGTAYQYYTTGSVALGIYPIPVPHDATGATAVIVPSERVIYGRIVKFDTSTSKYIDISGQVWRTGTAQWTFTADDNQYLLLASAFDSQDTEYNPEPTSVSVTFTK